MPEDTQTIPAASQDSASFLRRLAGPSIMKAGLAKDQTEINRVIAEASKGSKFYENEKRKDKELTEKIAKMLKQRDEVLREADLNKVERSVDQLLEKMEAQRDLSQFIVHVDMDAFYANVELLDNPSLIGKPFAVGHSVVSTASYEARKYGVRSGMPEYIAKKLCSDLIVISTHFPRYMELSKQIMDIFRRYDPNMCPAGCDEGYLNITRYCEDHLLSAEECVKEMRETVFNETRLTVSAGVAPNKMLAKICSDKNKPNGQFILQFDPVEIKAFMKSLPIRKIPGVGRINERLLDSIGIKVCGDIYTHRATVSLMDKHFGSHFLLQTYLGIASNIVEPHHREERKSIGAERTFSALGDKDQILAKLEEVAAELEEDMEYTGWTGKTITLKYKLDTYQVFTRAKSFTRWISTKKEDLFAIGKELLLPELPLRVRLIGLRVTKLKDLRTDPDSKPGSIKGFFEKAGNSSPQKRRKIDSDNHGQEAPRLSQDGYEEAMPGYHEDIEEDVQYAEEIVDSLEFSNTRSRRPPVSAPARSSEKPPFTSDPKAYLGKERHASAEPAAMSQQQGTTSEAASASGERETQVCPICSKTLDTDNRGLNEHIDFCLSKGAIREAQASTSKLSAPLRFPEASAHRSGARKRRRT